MTAPSGLKNLELSVANFGPIARAEVDLRPMTVFVGPSNTGKSYMAILIYALHRFFGGTVASPGFGPMFGSRSIFGLARHPEDARAIPAEDIDTLVGWFKDMSKRVHDANWPDGLLPELEEPVARLVRQRLEDTAGLGEFLDSELARCFGIENAVDLIRNGVKGGLSVVTRRPVPGRGSANESIEHIEYRYTRRGDNLDLAASVPSTISMPVTARGGTDRHYLRRLGIFRFGLEDDMSNADRAYLAESVLGALAGEYGSVSLGPLTNTPYYLPADRTGIMHAHRVVVSSLIGRAPSAALGPESPLPALSGVLADFLRILIGLGSPSRPGPGDRRNLADLLEQNMLSGAIRNRESVTGYPEFSYRPDGWRKDLPLMNTSSMVSELAPVVLYLRHVVHPGDLLIIEEPESHLHPSMQVEFIRHLSAAVRAGVRVIITTHSEWVLDELTNLVYMSDLDESDRDGIGGADYALSRDEVGVWLFKPKKRPRGSAVEEIPFDEDFGGFRSGFDDVAMGTYNDFAGISNRIQYRNSK